MESLQIYVFGTDIEEIGIEQIHHLRTHQCRFHRHIRKSVEAQHCFWFTENIVVHQDDVGEICPLGCSLEKPT